MCAGLLAVAGGEGEEDVSDGENDQWSEHEPDEEEGEADHHQRRHQNAEQCPRHQTFSSSVVALSALAGSPSAGSAATAAPETGSTRGSGMSVKSTMTSPSGPGPTCIGRPSRKSSRPIA